MSHKPFHYEVKNQVAGAAEILLYGFIGRWEEFDYPRFQGVFRESLKANKELSIRVHCGGGSVFEGLAIYDLIRASDCEVTVIIEGMAASMGFVIALAGDVIMINENAFGMAHAVKGGIYGNKQEMLNYIDLMDSCEDRLRNIFKERTKADAETIEGWLVSGKDFWLSAEACLELGIADQIVKPTKQRKTSEQDAENITNKTPEEAFECFNLYPEELPEEIIINQHTDMKKEAILATLQAAGLAGALTASSSDNDFENHLKDIVNKANKADSLKNELKEFKEAQAETLISNALKSGKISNTEKEDWKKHALENFALVAKSLERMSGKPDPNGNLERQKPPVDGAKHELLTGRDSWSYSDWQTKDPKGLETLHEEATEEFEKLFNAEFN
ncbi:hypothetical protein IW15_10125 [Chryseobacterium soli]|uniref:ATP-dependent Clp protease proteolytic subunit n=1 Tax=Chryseobacterium soli TaxID=445961 RepID=A0A086A8U6_9FLAO|nr:head maturation protease, ClpP-related [Chryseobacterium soli]KFF13110.1 hypothetical protein IW15_10125 [Chryseobacterium soli]